MSRDRILKSILANKPPDISLPDTIENSKDEKKGLTEKFIDLAKSMGSHVEEFDSEGQMYQWIKQKENNDRVFNLTEELSKVELQNISDEHWLDTDSLIIGGLFGVAENGAIWIDEQCMKDRKLPFVCGHLIMTLDNKNILTNMHQAYDSINLSAIEFGVFISGPSKTADIEQSLVIGAHGPIKHTILLY